MDLDVKFLGINNSHSVDECITVNMHLETVKEETFPWGKEGNVLRKGFGLGWDGRRSEVLWLIMKFPRGLNGKHGDGNRSGRG
jgi:hypothetical protein